MVIQQNILTKNDCYKSGRTITPICMQLHTIGTAQNSAASLASYWNQSGIQACVHYAIDAEQEGLVLQFLPDNRRSWADGGFGNGNAITVELMESDYMRYTSGANYSVTNEAKFKTDVTRAYNTAVQFFAQKCKEYGWNPQEKMSNGLHRVFSHDEGRRLGLSTSHVDPTHIWGRYGWTMDKFRSDVVKAMGGKVVEELVTKEQLYRVRKSWSDVNSQIFAGSLNGAKDVVNTHPGYYVFDSSGKLVYGNPDATSSAATSSEAKGIPASKEDYIAKVSKIAVELYKETKILPSVVIGQTCLENGYGLASDAIELTKRNNLLGMKAELLNSTWKEYSVWDGTSFTKRTPEVYNGKLTYINDAFRVYRDYENCIRDYEMFLLHVKSGGKLKYADVAGMTDPKSVITIISQRGYATDPAYITKVMKIINENNLTRYDQEAFASVYNNKKEDKPVADTTKTTTTSSTSNKVKWTGYIKRDKSIVRKAAGASKKQIAVLNKGDKVGVCGTTKSAAGNTWYLVKYGSNKYGYIFGKRVSKTYVAPPKTIPGKAAENAIKIANDNSHGYNNSYSGRGGNPDYACSSFVTDCFIKAGVNFGVTCDKVFTSDMKKIFTSHGFTDVSGKVNLKNGINMKVGDVVVKPGSHVEIFVGNGKLAGARGNAPAMKPENGKAGDQTGGEIAVSGYYYFGQTICLRYTADEKKTTVTTTTTTTPLLVKPTKPQYRVQLGVFGLIDNAIQLTNKAKVAGFDAMYFRDGGKYIVQAGVFTNKENADKLASRIRAAGFDVVVIVFNMK